MHQSVRPGWLLSAVIFDSHTPPDLILFPYSVFTMLLFYKSEFIVRIAGESGNLWISDRMLFMMYPCCNHLWSHESTNLRPRLKDIVSYTVREQSET